MDGGQKVSKVVLDCSFVDMDSPTEATSPHFSFVWSAKLHMSSILILINKSIEK